MKKIQKIAVVYPPIKKGNLTRKEAYRAMQMMLEDKIDPVQSGVFLIALRMKIETLEENIGILEALENENKKKIANINELLYIADPFNGSRRFYSISAFLAPVLASCGLSTVLTGCDTMGPKYGLTHRFLLNEAGFNPVKDIAKVTEGLEDKNQGWGYLDLSIFNSPLDKLRSLRNKIVKRSCLSTLEKILKPVTAKKNYLAMGYVHNNYPGLITKLTEHNRFDGLYLLKGIEGGIVPHLNRNTKGVRWIKGLHRDEFELSNIDIQSQEKNFSVESNLKPGELSSKGEPDIQGLKRLAVSTIKFGVSALKEKKGLIFDSLVYSAAAILWKLKKSESLSDAFFKVVSVICV